ncbi:23S rRNA (guanosine(2251)-2'-O)-methyltransferase RlmB [Geoglobus acetivorans]|uniref:23S rRNA (Guanosine(2251)-2'-O)-methyltransferase RlmB n=1 Tax=Geoglobus acetivorans TaxID=565033 RepID=A0ABZ3H2N3_GEOAI|nr:23S rRNA (guanosine(2251)-2'-O)-methyltransferase RlmB [Geoglobus acetivorans]
MRVSGINSVSEALNVGKVNKIYFNPDFRSERLKRLINTAKKAGVPVYAVNNIENKIVAEVSPIKYKDVDYVAEKAVRQGGFLLLLDSVQDPQNLGAVIRNAVFFGCSGVVIPKRRSAQINETVVKVSAGAVFHADIARVANLANTIKNLKKLGFHTVGAEIGGEKIENAFMDPPLAIVVGGEDRGLSNPVKKQCDEIVEIPGYGNVGSLNLSSASAVLMYEFRRRLK